MTAIVFSILRAQAPSGEPGGDPGDLALAGGTIYTGTGQVLRDSVVVVRGGRIERVGLRSEVAVPEGMRVISCEGRALIPGLVDLWADRPEGASGGQTDHRVDDVVEPFPDVYARALSEGVTTAAVAPSPSRGVGGLGSVLKLRSRVPGALADLSYRRDSHLVLALGMVPPGLGLPRISTADRLEQYYALRQRFASARDYRKSWQTYYEAAEKYNRELLAQKPSTPAAGEGQDRKPEEKKPEDKKPEEKKPEEKKPEENKADEKKAEEAKKPRPPEKPRLDHEKEVLLRALDRKIPVLLVAQTKADIGFTLRLKEEFGLELAVAGATEGYRATGDLLASKVRVAVGPALLTRWSLDLVDHRESNAAQLAAAGIPLAISSLGGAASPGAALRLEACVAVRGGLPPERALRAITAEPAAFLGLGDRLGTIEPGKDGDLVVLDGDPWSALTRVVQVVVEGRLVYESEAEL